MMKAIIFDFGNVVGLFDHAKTLRRLEAFTEMPAAEMFATIYEGQLEDDFESGRLSIEEFLHTFQKSCRLGCDPETLGRAVADIFEPNREICSLIPELRSRYRILLGSNTNPLHSRHFLQQFREVLGGFHAIVLSHEIGVRKPDAGFFQHCQRVAGCQADQCLFVDDLPANVAGARAAGLQAMVYRRGEGFVSELRRLGIAV